MQSPDILDLVLLVLLGWAVLRGYMFGVVQPVFGIVGIGLGVLAAWLAAAPLAKLVPGIESELGRIAVACLIVFIVVAWFATWLGRKVESQLVKVSLHSANRWAGALLGGLRFCLWAAFVLETLYYHPLLTPALDRSLMFPVVRYGGFCSRLMVPKILPDAEPSQRQEDLTQQTPGHVAMSGNIEVWVASRWSGRTVERTVRVAGHPALRDVLQRGGLMSVGLTADSSVGPDARGRLTYVASWKADRPEDLDWKLSRTRWFVDAGLFSNVIDVHEEFRLADYFQLGSEPFSPSQRAEEDRWQAMMRELQSLEREISQRLAKRQAEHIEIPVHVTWEFPYRVLSSTGPSARVAGSSAFWDFDLAADRPAILSVRSAERGWGTWIVWLMGLLGFVAFASYARRRLTDSTSSAAEDESNPETGDAFPDHDDSALP